MYNKISSIILNSGKASGFCDAFIAQPDSLKEGLAGKLFFLAEISTKKNEAKKIFDFLVSDLEDNYYNDEKILLKDKIEGLKIENIFEAAISKTNKNFNDFLISEKIKLNLAMTNISLGVVYENKLHFSTFGRNKAFLIYQNKDNYEIINVETNASESKNLTNQEQHIDKAPSTIPSFFSSVISGDIPNSSYFMFTSEALPEYISSRDLISIITKLPPIVAAEQIKNILSKINSFIPFLGIIIKNTLGIDKQELHEEVEDNLSAHSSISSLNYTEEKTERMLEPAGIINISKIFKKFQRFVKELKPASSTAIKSNYYINSKTEIKNNEYKNADNPPRDFEKINSLNLAKANLFLVKEKLFFKKRPHLLNYNIRRLFSQVTGVFNVQYFKSASLKIKSKIKGLSNKNKSLLFVLIGLVLIFVLSISFTKWSQKKQAAINNYNNLLIAIEEKQAKIDSSLIYDNEESARLALVEARELLSYFPRDKKNQISTYEEIENSLKINEDKILKITRIDDPKNVNNLNGLGINNIIFVDDKIYAASSQKIYEIIPQSSESNIFEIPTATNLSNPQFDSKSIIYYWNTDRIVKFDLKNKQSSALTLSEELANKSTSYKIYSGNLYSLADKDNQIFKANLRAGAYQGQTDWIKESIDLSDVRDLFVDGNIYLLKNNGQVLKLRIGKLENYKSNVIYPEINNANKLLITSGSIYILDSEAKRLVVLALSDGHLVAQYQINTLTDLKDFTVNEKDKKAYFLAGEEVYEIPLN